MAFSDVGAESLKQHFLKGVAPLNKELGRGAYGRVFAVMYGGLTYAAKEIHPLLLDGMSTEELLFVKNSFIRECVCCSTIQHANIVQFVGVYYPSPRTSNSDTGLPVLVMELMDTNLSSYLQNSQMKIAEVDKFSILHDISLGLIYLHELEPPIVHRDLSSNNVMLTNKLVAKIGDLGVAKAIQADSRSKLTTAPGTLHFMPPECLDEVNPVYSTPVDVFSFAGIALHVFSEQWPTPLGQKRRDPKTNIIVSLTEVERRQPYLDKMTGEVFTLRPLVKRCLDDDPFERPTIQEVSEKIMQVCFLTVTILCMQLPKIYYTFKIKSKASYFNVILAKCGKQYRYLHTEVSSQLFIYSVCLYYINCTILKSLNIFICVSGHFLKV